MSLSYDYAIAQLEANPSRGERLNIGIVVFDPEGLRIHFARNLEKIRAISAAIDREMVEQALRNLVTLDHGLMSDGLTAVSDRMDALNQISAVTFAPAGRFFADSVDTYDLSIHRLMTQLVRARASADKGKAR